jgi:malic enzyme
LVTTGFRVKKEKQMNNIKVWLHGLAAAAISAFASAASGAIALPSVFTFDRNGFINMAKLATVPALLAVFAYLKSSPVPALNDR